MGVFLAICTMGTFSALPRGAIQIQPDRVLGFSPHLPCTAGRGRQGEAELEQGLKSLLNG